KHRELLRLSTRPRPPKSHLFPYTTLFRSHRQWGQTLATVSRHTTEAPGRVPLDWRRLLSWSNSCGAPVPCTAPKGHSTVNGIKADRKSTRLNSSHGSTSYAVFCLKKKKGTPSYTSYTTKLTQRAVQVPLAI